jgi:hypothetical protein
MVHALTTKDRSLRTGYIQLLIEYYFDLWRQDKTYREDQLYDILIRLEVDECLTWITAKLLALTLAYKREDRVVFNRLRSDLQFILSDLDVVEHLRVCIEITPHSYHLLLQEALQSETQNKINTDKNVDH